MDKIYKLKILVVIAIGCFNLTCFDMYGDILNSADAGNYRLTIVETYLSGARTLVSSSKGSMNQQIVFPGANYRSSNYADYDNDGNMDVLLIVYSGDPVIYFGDGHGGYKSNYTIPSYTLNPVVYANATKAVSSDFDEDGDIDIYVIGDSQAPFYIQNNGNNNYSVSTADSPFNYSCITSGDFDRDGDIDLIIGDATNNRIFFKENDLKQTGWVAGVDISILITGITDLKSADFDGDGDLDIIAVYSNNPHRVLLNNGNATFTQGWSWPSTENMSSVSVADFDNDGDMDAFVSNFTAAGYDQLLINNGEGIFTVKNMISFETSVNLVTNTAIACDIDIDGDIDIIRATYDGALSFTWIHLNNGEGNFSNFQSISVANPPSFSLSAGVFR